MWITIQPNENNISSSFFIAVLLEPCRSMFEPCIRGEESLMNGLHVHNDLKRLHELRGIFTPMPSDSKICSLVKSL